jgi:HEAT repeat protein
MAESLSLGDSKRITAEVTDMLYTTTAPAAEPTTIQQQIDALADTDVIARDRARHALVRLGQAAVRPLMQALDSSDEIVRWEATKALGELADPAAAPALIAALDDQRFAVRWLAAEGLIALKEAGVVALLEALMAASWDNVWLREGAHHVLRSQLRAPFGHLLAPVVSALEGPEASVTAPTKAHHAVEALRQDQQQTASRR